jgi:hypothetical protein
MKKELQNNSMIIYEWDNWNISVDILAENDTFWMTQTQIWELFWKDRSTITKHIWNIYLEEELFEENTIVQKTHNWSIKPTNYYNLDLILAVWYRVKSKQWAQFRIWATARLKEYLTQGFSLNEEKLKSWKITEYFDKLQDKLRQIRLSERLFYQKIKDIYTTSIDYDAKDDKTILFFKTVQNKLLWAISQKTAAELVYDRIDILKPLLWMQSFDKEDSKQITKRDVIIAKNYLNEKEMKTLWLLVEQFLAFAETMAESKQIMKMNDWIKRLDLILKMNWKDILTHYWKVSHKLALEKSEIEYLKLKENNRKNEKMKSLDELENDLRLLND